MARTCQIRGGRGKILKSCQDNLLSTAVLLERVGQVPLTGLPHLPSPLYLFPLVPRLRVDIRVFAAGYYARDNKLDLSSHFAPG